MSHNNFKMAISSIRANLWRSFLTILGVVIGVMSIITIISLGEGVRRQVVKQIDNRGKELITVMPGNIDLDSWYGSLANINGGGALTEADWVAAQQTPGITATAPFATVDALPRYKDKSYTDISVVATTEEATELINHQIAHGVFFNENDQNINSAVIGRRVAEEVFKENVPLGKSLDINGEAFMVHGVFEEIGYQLPILAYQNFDNSVLLSYDSAKRVTGGSLQINQILIKPADVDEVEAVAENVRQSLEESRGSEVNFSVLTNTEVLKLTNNIVNLLTSFVVGIAAISLLVGGIGIMNIMLVAVSERTKEIGIRKAVGATNRQIMSQFLVEAVVLCLTGSALGVAAAALVNFIIMIVTPLEPLITLPVVGLTVAVCLAIGIIFGLIPAVRAARMTPIDALRYE